jgi:hypothetical protein
MNDDKKLNQPTDTTNSDDYQKILDEAAASIKPEDTQIPPTETDTNEPEPIVKLKDINSLQLENPEEKIIASSTNIPSTENNEFEQDITPPIIPKEAVAATEESPKTPEEIKAQIDKILADDSTNNSSQPDDLSSSLEVSKKSFNFKSIFIISLIIFFVIAGLWAYFLFFYQPVTKQSPAATSPTPTEIISQETCELNGTTYKVGESFKSADGCNTCTCQSANIIVCTEMACSIVPTSTSATKSATTSSVPKDWKTYTNSNLKFNFKYPGTWKILDETLSNKDKKIFLRFVTTTEVAEDNTNLFTYFFITANPENKTLESFIESGSKSNTTLTWNGQKVIKFIGNIYDSNTYNAYIWENGSNIFQFNTAEKIDNQNQYVESIFNSFVYLN